MVQTLLNQREIYLPYDGADVVAGFCTSTASHLFLMSTLLKLKLQCYFATNGIKQPMYDDLLDFMSSILEREEAISSSSEEEPITLWRVTNDEKIDNRPNDPNYFKLP